MNFDQIWQRAQQSKAIVYDAETDGLDKKRNKIVGHVLTFSADPKDSIYLPVRHEGGNNLDLAKTSTLIKKIMTLPNRKIGFNFGFDLYFLNNDGIEVKGPLEDGMVNASLVDERQGKFSLDACCKFMNVTEKKGDDLYKHLAEKFGGEPNRNQMANFWKLPGDDPLVVDYATGDGTSTWDLVEAQQKVMDDQELRTVWAVECRVIRVLHRMSWRGVKINEERLHLVHKLTKERYELAMSKLPKDFNSKAPTHLLKFFTDAGITDWPKTAKGAPSFNKEWLATNEPGRLIVRARKLRHLLDSFLTPMFERHLFKGRIHSTFNQTRGEEFGTITGRLSSSDPSIHQIHKRDEEIGSIFRSIFVPDEGMTWASGDIDQCEPRLLAHYGQVKVLLDGYLSDPPIDAHTAVAKAAFSGGKSPTKDQRQSGKTLNQALITGAGKKKAAKMLNKPMDEANKIVSDYFARMPEISTFQRRAADVMMARGYVKSLLGRRCRSEGPEWGYLAVNRLLQTGNADIIKKEMADVDEYYCSEGDRVHLLNNVHDDLCHQFYEDDRKIFKEGIRLMEDFGPNGQSVKLSVPIVVDVGEGDSWAAATFGKDKVEKMFKEWGSKYD